MAEGINIKFPFEESEEDGVFALNTTTDQAYRDDMVALLTLRRGQRPMRSTMYSPIYDYLHEPLDDISTKGLDRDIRKKVGEFVPQVSIQKITFLPKPDESLLGIKIIFTINDLFEVEQSLELNIPTGDAQTQ